MEARSLLLDRRERYEDAIRGPAEFRGGVSRAPAGPGWRVRTTLS